MGKTAPGRDGHVPHHAGGACPLHGETDKALSPPRLDGRGMTAAGRGGQGLSVIEWCGQGHMTAWEASGLDWDGAECHFWHYSCELALFC